MKRSHILSLLFVAALIGSFIATFTSTSRSVSFAEAASTPGEECKISGTLNRNFPVVYEPEIDPTRTAFHMIDGTGQTQFVVLNQPKPTGLENSESIDLYGSIVGDEFHATEMLMKCPSKYNENNHVLIADEAQTES